MRTSARMTGAMRPGPIGAVAAVVVVGALTAGVGAAIVGGLLAAG